MDIYSPFKPLAELEGTLAEFYGWCKTLFKGDEDAASLFSRLAADELSHVAIIDYQRRLVRDRPGEFTVVQIDLQPVAEAMSLIAVVRQSNQPPALDQAVRVALTLETNAAEYHCKTAMQQANPGVAELLEALGSGDREHLARLVRFAGARGLEHTPGTSPPVA